MSKIFRMVMYVCLFLLPLAACDDDNEQTPVEITYSVSLNESSLNLLVGESETLEVVVSPSLPEGETVEWTSDNPTVAEVENGVVTALTEGEAVVTANYGESNATCTVTVTLDDPKVGDYFYSDGTWSDGGLISMDADGQNAVWADEKPAPISGKTVIGIVFQTQPERLAQSDIEKGYQGYVVATRTAHGADKPTTWWSTDWDFTCLKAAKLASTWYTNVNGYEETMTVKETYVDNLAEMMPAFDLVLNHFPVEAPASTSGWFLPSTGQMWDMIANLCGSEAATIMKEWQTMDYDATWYCSEKVSYNAIAYFNSMMALVPAADKEEMVIDNDNYCSMWTSTPYDSESACIMDIGEDGLIECMANWYDGDCVARPILAF